MIIFALGFFSLINSASSNTLASGVLSTLEIRIVVASLTWSLKNSPKLRIYSFPLAASTTVTSILGVKPALAIIFLISDNFPTPDGSIITLSGLYSLITSVRAFVKSPTSVQQIQPELISLISNPASFKKPESTPISPNSFSIKTTFSPL